MAPGALAVLTVSAATLAAAWGAGAPSPPPSPPEAESASPPPASSARTAPSPSPTPPSPPPLLRRVVNDHDEPPTIVHRTKPRYPKYAFWERIEGTVDVEFVIDDTGKVREARVTRSVPGLDEAALDCVKQWRFTPARKAGRPVESTALAPVTFRITDKKKE